MDESWEFLKALTPGEVEFLVRLGNELANRRPEPLSFDRFCACGHYQNYLGQEWFTHKLSYIDRLKWYVDLKACLDIREKYSDSPNKRLPKESTVSEKILVKDGLWGVDSPELTRERASAIRESLAAALGMRKILGIKQIRDEIIIQGYMADPQLTQRQIATNLDAHPDSGADSTLKKWMAAYPLVVNDWLGALDHPELGPNVKSLFSKTWKRYRKGS